MEVFIQIDAGDGRLNSSLKDVPWLWGVEEYPGLGSLVLACYEGYRQAKAAALKKVSRP